MRSYPLNFAIITSLLWCGFFEGNIVLGQESAVQNSKKETVEPVFRVPKIASGVTGQPPSSNSVDSSFESNSDGDGPISQPVESSVAPPVARVAAATEANASLLDIKKVDLTPPDLATVQQSHPLDRAVNIAKEGLQRMQSNIHDYTAVLVKRERVNNVLSEPHYMRIKIRNPRTIEQQQVPFSIYMKFIKPRTCAGREVIWVQGQNNGSIIAHESSALLKFRNFYLDPTGMLAMKGNKYPIYDAGLENLTIKLIEKAERDRAAGKCVVHYKDGAKINKRPCSVIEVVHDQRRLPYEFHVAKVYIDDEYQIPVRYVSYDWPTPGQKPPIIEEYTYIQVKINVGLNDLDFSPRNPLYNFAKN